MNVLRTLLALGFSIGGCANLAAGQVVLPSDVSVTLTAEPSVNLQSEERVTFTISVTNHGPESVDRLPIGSSPIYDELDVFTASSSDCEGDIVLGVADLENTFYFFFTYFVASLNSPLAVGETRVCHLSLDYTQWAPSVFQVTFAFPDWLFDLDPSNNSATVYLRRAAAATAIPTLSPGWLVLLACLLTGIVAYVSLIRTTAA